MADAGTPGDRAERLSPAATKRLSRAILVGSLGWAALILSGPFLVSTWIVGDIAYHRGVAYTMLGSAWQGEGPFVGLLTYYGGLYPMVIGRLAGLLGAPFDVVLSVVSWPLGVVWPVACWWLARRVWPGQPLPVALFVLLATVTAPFTHRVLLWVDSPLASAQAVTPLFPRDVALTLVVVAVGFALAGGRRARILGVGFAIGGIVLVHVQVALLTGYLIAVLAGAEAWRRRDLRVLAELAAAGGIALAVSAWWWIPRALAAVASRGLWLGGYPGSPPLRLGPDNVFQAFGVVGVLAILGFAVMAARSRPFPREIAPFIVWLVALLPLVLVDRFVGGSDLVSERRLLLLGSIPLTVIAAWTAAAIIGRLRPIAAVAAVILLIVTPSLPGTVATARLVEDAWQPGRAGGRTFDALAWDPLFADLARRVATEGRHVTLSYDAYETWIWSFSGSQVPSLWLPGPFKLGFDPAVLTGTGYLDRLRAQEVAFAGGLGTICADARAVGAGSIVLDVEGHRLGVFDASPASAYRVDPSERSDSTIQRQVGPGQTYLDNGGFDVLRLAPRGQWSPPFEAPAGSLVAVELTVPILLTAPNGLTTGDLLRIRAGEQSIDVGSDRPSGPARFTLEAGPGGGPIVLTGLADADLQRVTVFVPAEGIGADLADGPMRFDPSDLCGPAS